MRRPSGRRAAVALLAFCSACASSQGRPPRAVYRADRNLITQQQIIEYKFTNAFDAVQALHSNWLQARGTDSFRSPGQVLVYFDNIRLGGVESLRGIELGSILFIRHFDGISATARWGLDHGQGVIYVSTHP